MSDIKTRTCSKCLQTKAESDFYAGKKHGQCKKCIISDNKHRYKKVGRSLFDQMDESKRLAIITLWLEGKTYKQIAELQGVKECNLELWFKPKGRAREKARTMMMAAVAPMNEAVAT